MTTPALANLAAVDATPEDPLLNSRHARAHVGGISEMTRFRWTRDLEFPRPDVVIARRNFWRRSTLDSWISRQSPGRQA